MKVELFFLFEQHLILVNLWAYSGALCASYLMDKEGRQKLLIGSYLGMVSR